MKMRARVSCLYKREITAKAIASSIEPDNRDSPKEVKIKTGKSGKKVETEIEMDGRIETLIATLEDLLSCISTAEKMVEE